MSAGTAAVGICVGAAGPALGALTASATGGGPDSGLTGWVLDVVERLGGPGVGLLVLLENLFPPIPSEVVLPLAGFTAGQGRFSVWEAILWSTAGSVVGALILYGIAAALGTKRLAAIADRLPLTGADDVHRADAWFTRWGAWAVLFGRLIPGIRSLISIPAGVVRMPLLAFTAYTTLGSAVWNSVLIGVGYALGAQYERVKNYIGPAGTVVVGIIAVVILYAIGKRIFLAYRNSSRDSDPERGRGAGA